MNKEIAFNIKVNANGADATIDKVTESTNGLNEEVVDLNATFEEVYGNVKPLTNRIGELEDRMYELALAGKQDTEEFKVLQAQLVEYRKTILAVDHSVDQLTESGRGLSIALEVGSHIVNGYQTLQGAQALLGIESEELLETMIKLQGATALLSSIEQVKISLDRQSIVTSKIKAVSTAVMTKVQTLYTVATTGATVATRALSVAMLALPIVAIVAGLATLVGWLVKASVVTDGLKESNEQLNRVYDVQTKALDRLDKRQGQYYSDQRAVMEASGATREQLYQLDQQRLLDEEVNRRQRLAYEKEYYAGLLYEYKAALKEGESELAKDFRTQIKATKDRLSDLKSEKQRYEIDSFLLQKKYESEGLKLMQENANKVKELREKANQKAKEDREKAEQLRLDRQKYYEDLMVANIKDATIRELAGIQLKYKREEEELIKKYGRDSELIKGLEVKRFNELLALTAKQDEELSAKKKEALEKENETRRANELARINGDIIAMRNHFDVRLELQKELVLIERNQALEDLTITEDQKYLIEQEYQQKLDDLRTEYAEREKELNKKRVEDSLNAFGDLNDSMQRLSDGMFQYQLNNVEKGSAQELAIRKRQFEWNKKLQVAQATMQGIQAGIASYTSGAAIGGPVLGAVYAGISAIATGAQIAGIKSTQFDGGGNAVRSDVAVNIPTVPSESNYNGVSTSTDNYTGLNPIPQQGIKVTIVDSEIKNALDSFNKVEVISGF